MMSDDSPQFSDFPESQVLCTITLQLMLRFILLVFDSIFAPISLLNKVNKNVKHHGLNKQNIDITSHQRVI